MPFAAKTLFGLLAAAALSACQQSADTGDQAANVKTAQGSASASGGTQQAAAQTISAALGASRDHSTFVQTLKGAGLEQTFAGAGPYTVFAPTNAGFQKLPAGTAEGLMRAESKSALTGLLTYHVVPGVITSKDLATSIERGGGKAQLATMGGSTLTATRFNGGIILADAKGGQARVTQADMIASNGVVHSIDGVLTPQ